MAEVAKVPEKKGEVQYRHHEEAQIGKSRKSSMEKGQPETRPTNVTRKPKTKSGTSTVRRRGL